MKQLALVSGVRVRIPPAHPRVINLGPDPARQGRLRRKGNGKPKRKRSKGIGNSSAASYHGEGGMDAGSKSLNSGQKDQTGGSSPPTLRAGVAESERGMVEGKLTLTRELAG